MQNYLITCDELDWQERFPMPEFDDKAAGIQALQLLIQESDEQGKKVDDVHATLYREVSTW